MGSSKKSQTVGYRYGLTVHMGVCYGAVDAVIKILADDRDVYTQQITQTGIIGINVPNLFGGDAKEGGLIGTMDVQMGNPDQTPSPLLTASLGQNIPAFRGILGFVYNGIMSANNPYLKPFSFVVRRILKGWRGDVWYPEKAVINNRDANPAHIIYECLTNTDWGMGYPAVALDDASFRHVADALYNEGFGLSLIWNQQNTIEAFLGIIFNHIAGNLKIDPKTGLYQVQLIRQDYLIDDLYVFDPENITALTSFERAGWGELVNEVTLKYTDPDTFNETAITVQNLAAVQVQNGVINQTLTFTGITSHSLAQRVAQRELMVRSSPVAKCSFQINRRAWRLMPGDAFILRWPKLGIANLIMRVASTSTGTLDDGKITIEAVEDVFGLPASSYTEQEQPGWTDPLQPPAPSPNRIFTEATHFDLVTNMSAADLSYVDPDDGYAVMFASSPSVGAYDYSLMTAAHGEAFKSVDTSNHCATGIVLNDTLIAEHSTLEIATSQPDEIVIGAYAVIGSEYVRIDAFDAQSGQLSIARGTLDTVPQSHDAGSIIYFAEDDSAIDPSPWPAGAVVDAKVITRTGMGEIALADAPTDTQTITARHSKPIAPGKFRINSEYLPDRVRNEITVSWARRNRIIQDSNLIAQNESDIAPEDGQTATIKIFNQNDVLCRTVTDITGTSYTYSIIDELADCGGQQTHIRIELLAVRGGIESWQSHSHRFEREYQGYGFNYGNNWGLYE